MLLVPNLTRWRRRALVLGILSQAACARPISTPVPPLPTALTSIVRAYAGCWTLSFDRPFPGAGIDTVVTVALDTSIISVRGDHAALLARGLAGFTRGRKTPFALLWQPQVPPDTTELAIRSTSGVGWRLWVVGDSVTGRAFEFWDLGPSETDAGHVRGHRLACP
jgi:hypothetical protein